MTATYERLICTYTPTPYLYDLENSLIMLGKGLEPSRSILQRILSPSRLPNYATPANWFGIQREQSSCSIYEYKFIYLDIRIPMTPTRLELVLHA